MKKYTVDVILHCHATVVIQARNIRDAIQKARDLDLSQVEVEYTDLELGDIQSTEEAN